MNPPVLLQGKKIGLRLFTENDLQEYHRHCNNIQEMGDFWPLNEIVSFEQLKARFRENGMYQEDRGRLLMVDSNNEMVGLFVFYIPLYFCPGFGIGYRIFEQRNWGKGYATEAVKLMSAFLFESRRTGRIQITTDPTNLPSNRVAEKAGFKFEGVLRQEAYVRGVYRDSNLYSILPQECPPLASLLKS